MVSSFNFTVPEGWHALTDRQLRYVYRLMSTEVGYDDLRLLCLLRWSATRVVGRQPGGAFLLQHRKTLFEATPVAIAQLLPALEWLGSVPPRPVRPSKLKGRKALPADFAGVPFETFLVCENLYQGYLATQRDDLLDALGAVLYPGVRGALTPTDRIAVFYWMASLKEWLSQRYAELFQPVPENEASLGPASSTAEDSMNAQIRALTKGDVTKEREILNLDTWRALTELNAQACEYRQLNSKLNEHH